VQAVLLALQLKGLKYTIGSAPGPATLGQALASAGTFTRNLPLLYTVHVGPIKLRHVFADTNARFNTLIDSIGLFLTRIFVAAGGPGQADSIITMPALQFHKQSAVAC
jgi:hypothetical protein